MKIQPYINPPVVLISVLLQTTPPLFSTKYFYILFFLVVKKDFCLRPPHNMQSNPHTITVPSRSVSVSSVKLNYLMFLTYLSFPTDLMLINSNINILKLHNYLLLNSNALSKILQPLERSLPNCRRSRHHRFEAV